MANPPVCKICKTAHWSGQGHSCDDKPKKSVDKQEDRDKAAIIDDLRVKTAAITGKAAPLVTHCVNCATKDGEIKRQTADLLAASALIIELRAEIDELTRANTLLTTANTLLTGRANNLLTANTPANTINPVSTQPANTTANVLTDANSAANKLTDRKEYMRELMRAKRAAKKASNG